MGKTLKVYDEEYKKLMFLRDEQHRSIAKIMKDLIDKEMIRVEKIKEEQKSLIEE